MDVSLSKLREIGKDREAWCAVVHGVTKVRTQLHWMDNNKKDQVVYSLPYHMQGKETEVQRWEITCPENTLC